MISSINPATEELLAEFEPWSAAQVDEAVGQVVAAQRAWRGMSIEERSVPMRRAAELLRERAGRYGALITSEMGKPIVEAEAEVTKCALACDHYADHAAEYLADAPVATESLESYVAYQPLGVVLAIMPWNFPFWQVFRAGAPSLMAGNGIVLKHASNVPQSALATEEVIRDAGFPDGLLRTVLVAGSDTERLIDDERIAAVTLTGSSEVGARIASLAAGRLKKQVLELGGSDPFVVLADANLEHAARTAARARNQNNGQSCIAAKRFIVEEPVADEFGTLFADAVRALRVGDPASRETNVGPLARSDLRDTLERQVTESRRMGAEPLVGGDRVNGTGLLLRAHGPRRRHRGHARVPRGDVRSGRGAAARARRRPRHRPRQRQRVRAGGGGLDPRPGRGEGDRAPDRGGHGLRERPGRLGPAHADGRRQAQRLRPRAGAPRHLGVHEHPDRAHRSGGSHMTDRPIKLGANCWGQYTDWASLRAAGIRADSLGYDSLWTWDHLYPIVGSHEGPIFEGWLTLAAWAEATERATVGLMVGANTFRNPALVARMATTLDHISGGRAVLGIGGAWFETEHRGLGHRVRRLPRRAPAMARGGGPDHARHARRHASRRGRATTRRRRR